MNHPTQTQHITSTSAGLNVESGKSAIQAVTQMLQEGSLRSRENDTLSQDARREMLAAEQRTSVFAITLAEDYARKLTLLECSRSAEAVEREIARATADALRNCETLRLDQIEALYITELGHLEQARAWFDAGLLSQECYDRVLADIGRATDEAVHDAGKKADELWGEILRHRKAWLAADGKNPHYAGCIGVARDFAEPLSSGPRTGA